MTWPTTRISVCRPPGASFDVVLVRGIEPNMRWRSFCDEVLDAVNGLSVKTVVTLGALLSDSPHTRPTPVSGTAYDSASATKYGLEPSKYEGPTGIVGILQDACAAIGVPALSFWAAVPHYVPNHRTPRPPSPCCTGSRRPSTSPWTWVTCPRRRPSGRSWSTRWRPRTKR